MKEFCLSEKIRKRSYKAVMKDTTKWGRIPMVETESGDWFGEQIRKELEIYYVKEFIEEIQKEGTIILADDVLVIKYSKFKKLAGEDLI